jgi:anti-sigma B factor antagonist
LIADTIVCTFALFAGGSMLVDVINLSKISSETGESNNLAVKISAAKVFDADGSGAMLVILMALIKGGILKMVIDLDGLDFIDSRGIGTLINAAKLIRERHGDLVLAKVPESIDKIFRPVNLQRFIKIFPSEQDALNYLKYL